MGAQSTPLLAACLGQSTPVTPVWFMRQAGRHLPEYRALRGSGSILDALADPDLSTEITLQPVRRYGVDGAVLYSDIVVPVAAIGFGVDVEPGRGPVVAEPFRGPEDLKRLRPLDVDADIPHVTQTVAQVAAELRGSPTTLIGFAGAPFTVASYLVEGGPSKNFAKVKSLMHADPALFGQLCDRLAGLAIDFLAAQVANGAQVVQLFDSWAGQLSVADYERFALPSTRRVLAEVAAMGVPSILFGVGCTEHLPAMATAGASVVGVDWRIPLSEARRRLGPGIGVQGNLDPTLVLAGVDVALEATDTILADAAGTPGHVFNLGHGVLPETDPDVLAEVVKRVHAGGAS